MASKKQALAEQVEEAPPTVELAPEQTQEHWNKMFEAHGWTLHSMAKRWYPPLATGEPHLPDGDGKPAYNTTRFLHMSDINAAIEHGTTDELLKVIVSWGQAVAG